MSASKLLSAILVVSVVMPATRAAAQIRVLKGAQMAPARRQMPLPIPRPAPRPVPRTQSSPSSDWVTLFRLSSGTDVIVTLKDRTTESGDLQVVDETTITVNVDGQPLTLKRDDVLVVEVTTNHAAERAITGGIAGAGTGLFIRFVLGGVGGSIPAGTTAKLTGSLAALGAVQGAVAGALQSTTTVVYRAN